MTNIVSQLIVFLQKNKPVFFYPDKVFHLIATLLAIFLLYLYFSVNTGKYGPEKTRYLDTFHAVLLSNLS